VAVTFVFFITDCLFAIVMMVAWDLPWYLALAFFIFFGTLDAVYLSATLNKVGLAPFLLSGRSDDVMTEMLSVY
jgi:K+ transporter